MAKKKDDDGPMIVVAKQAGYYGNTPRRPGARFPINSKQEFSKRWMLDANDPANAREISRLEANLPDAQKRKDVDDETLLAEISQSMGMVPALRAENAALKKQVEELQLKLAELDANTQPPQEEANGEDEPSTDGEAGEAEAGDAGEVKADGDEAVSEGQAEKPSAGRRPRRKREV